MKFGMFYFLVARGNNLNNEMLVSISKVRPFDKEGYFSNKTEWS